MVRRDGSRVRCFTRKGYDWANRFPAIVDAARRIKASSFLIDGEVVIARDDGTVARRLEIDQGLYDDRAGTSVVQRELLPMARSGSIWRRSAARRAPPASFSAQNGANCCVTG
jgi:hypothetical protein